MEKSTPLQKHTMFSIESIVGNSESETCSRLSETKDQRIETVKQESSPISNSPSPPLYSLSPPPTPPFNTPTFPPGLLEMQLRSHLQNLPPTVLNMMNSSSIPPLMRPEHLRPPFQNPFPMFPQNPMSSLPFGLPLGAPSDYQFNPWMGNNRPRVPIMPGMPEFMLPFRRQKRVRTAFSQSQLIKLEEAFEKNQYLVGQERKELAKSLQLTETQVEIVQSCRMPTFNLILIYFYMLTLN